MKRLCLGFALCLWSGVALAQDQVAPDRVSLDFQWPQAARWRVIEQWELEVIAPDGQKDVHSGVVRSLWSLDRSSGTPVVSSRQAVVVRTTPRVDPDAVAIAARLVVPWHADVGPRPVAPPPPPPPAPEPAVATDPAAPADGTDAASAAAATPAPAVVVEPAVAVVAAPPPVYGRPDMALLVAGDPADQIDRIFHAFDDQTLKSGTDFFVDASAASGVTGEARPAEVRRRVDPLQWCADQGPGSSCVELGVRRQEGGASPEGLLIPAGARRINETWVVEPSTLAPHSARVETVVGWNGDNGVWRARVTKILSFLPADPPRALQLH